MADASAWLQSMMVVPKKLEAVQAEIQAHIAAYPLWCADRDAWWQRGMALIRLRDRLSGEKNDG